MRLSDKQREAARLLAEGKNTSEVARQLGKNRATIHRWRALPGFDAAVGVARVATDPANATPLRHIQAEAATPVAEAPQSAAEPLQHQVPNATLEAIATVVRKTVEAVLDERMASLRATTDAATQELPEVAHYLSKERLTTKEAAAILGIGNSKLTTLAKTGAIRSLQVRPNANRQYARDDILAFAASRISG